MARPRVAWAAGLAVVASVLLATPLEPTALAMPQPPEPNAFAMPQPLEPTALAMPQPPEPTTFTQPHAFKTTAFAKPHPRQPTGRLAVTGYAEDGTRAAIVAREAHALTTVGVDGVALRTSGASITPVDADVRLLERAAHRNHLRAELLVSNYSGAIGDFSPQIGSRLLRDRAHIEAVTSALARVVRRQGWDGVTVDLESLRAGDGSGLTRFVRRLGAKLPAGRSVSIDLMASTRLSEYRARGYQLARLGRVADVLALMTYDLHGPSWSGPGPVGPLPWQRAAVRTLLTQVPAREVDLGVAGYGYTWPRSPHRHDGRVVTDRRARRLVAQDGVHARWAARRAEWTATLHNGTVLWWSDGRSWLSRVGLARHLGLHGLALWRLGSADALP